MMKASRAVVWFRADLRLHDNEALYYAIRRADEVIPIFVFDERQFKGQTSFGFPKTGKYRTQFWIDSVADLRMSLRKKGIDLVVRVGKPEEEIFKLASEIQSGWVFCNMERTEEEVQVQDTLEKKLWSIGQEILFHRGKMLYYTQDLPFPVAHTPDIFTQFRKEVEGITPIREPLPSPEKFSPWSVRIDVGEMPTLSDFGHEPFETDTRAVLPFQGGETAGLARLKNYLWDSDAVKTYKETRNGMIGANYSTKFSAWLANGCLSPKMIYHELRRYERTRVKNESTYWVYFELLWRDYFRLIAKKYGNKIFQPTGINGASLQLRNNEKQFEAWATGKTGIPFVDANMQELNATGFMSNRGRQNVASFLVKDLKVNWLMGAEYFESLLVDYDVSSNYCNWNYVAGIGNDPREDRYFNVLSQAKRFDPNGEYVRRWLPQLANLSGDKAHRPDLLSREEQTRLGVVLGADYPLPIVNTSKWGG